MSIRTIDFNGKSYPEFQSKGFSAKYIFPFAKEFCEGLGYDVGCNRIEWCLPGAIPIDIRFNDGYDAFHLPKEEPDFIFSSHCLEHINDWILALDYWTERLKDKGVLFLYLPDYSQEYWRPWNNYKHKNIFTPEIIKDYLVAKGYKSIFMTGKDLNDSFAVVGEKNIK